VTAVASYYEASVGPREPRPALRGLHQAQVCIVGAGFAGLATALGLLERGVRDVIVVEARRVGFGASGRNGGFVFGGYSLDCADLLAQLGPEQARAMYARTQAAVVLIRRRIAQHAIDCDAVDGGALLANWFDDDALLRRQQALMREHFDVQWEWIARERIGEFVDSTRYFGGLLEHDAFHFHPLKYALGEARVVESLGGRIFEGSPVQRIERERGGHVVHTEQGEVQARHVVLAGGGYLRGVCPALERAVLPIATYIAVTEPLGEAIGALGRSRVAVYDTRFAFDYYRALPDTRLLWGGRISVRDRDPAQIARFLRADMLAVLPQLAATRFEFAWSGMMSYARHKMPQVGALADGLWHAVGFGGHGVAPTTAAGEALAEAIAGGAPLPDGFARYGLAPTYGPVGLAAAELSYLGFRVRDWVKARARSTR